MSNGLNIYKYSVVSCNCFAQKMVEPPFTGCLRILLVIMRRYFTIMEGITISTCWISLCVSNLFISRGQVSFGAAFFGACMHFLDFQISYKECCGLQRSGRVTCCTMENFLSKMGILHCHGSPEGIVHSTFLWMSVIRGETGWANKSLMILFLDMVWLSSPNRLKNCWTC